MKYDAHTQDTSTKHKRHRARTNTNRGHTQQKHRQNARLNGFKKNPDGMVQCGGVWDVGLHAHPRDAGRAFLANEVEWATRENVVSVGEKG